MDYWGVERDPVFERMGELDLKRTEPLVKLPKRWKMTFEEIIQKLELPKAKVIGVER